MVLRVALEDFPEAVRQYAQTAEVFIAPGPAGVSLSAVNPVTGVIVSTASELGEPDVRKMLEAAGLTVREGEWSKQAEGDVIAEHYVVAVAYRSKEQTPGLWMDAFTRAPTVMEVLRTMYEEFVETGEASSATFEQFLNSAQPNVVVLSPDELAAFAAAKS